MSVNVDNLRPMGPGRLFLTLLTVRDQCCADCSPVLTAHVPRVVIPLRTLRCTRGGCASRVPWWVCLSDSMVGVPLSTMVGMQRVYHGGYAEGVPRWVCTARVPWWYIQPGYPGGYTSLLGTLVGILASLPWCPPYHPGYTSILPSVRATWLHPSVWSGARRRGSGLSLGETRGWGASARLRVLLPVNVGRELCA